MGIFESETYTAQTALATLQITKSLSYAKKA